MKYLLAAVEQSLALLGHIKLFLHHGSEVLDACQLGDGEDDGLGAVHGSNLHIHPRRFISQPVLLSPVYYGAACCLASSSLFGGSLTLRFED